MSKSTQRWTILELKRSTDWSSSCKKSHVPSARRFLFASLPCLFTRTTDTSHAYTTADDQVGGGRIQGCTSSSHRHRQNLSRPSPPPAKRRDYTQLHIVLEQFNMGSVHDSIADNHVVCAPQPGTRRVGRFL